MLISFVGVDNHGYTSAYLMSDSRICWDSDYYDNARKLFASKKYPDIFGFVGDTLFPSIVLAQIIGMIDNGLLISERMDAVQKNKIIFEKIIYELKRYPERYRAKNVTIIHMCRDDSSNDKYPRFFHFELSFDANKRKHIKCVQLPDVSDIVKTYGSGSGIFNSTFERLKKIRKNKYTTRCVFQSFIEVLKNHSDGSFGGPPQIVGLYRKPQSVAIEFGIIYNRKRYFLGTEVPRKSCCQNIEWRNTRFEICDGDNKRIKPGASKQPVE